MGHITDKYVRFTSNRKGGFNVETGDGAKRGRIEKRRGAFKFIPSGDVANATLTNVCRFVSRLNAVEA